MPNKSKKTGFMAFTDEWMRKCGNEVDLPEAIQETVNIWMNMPPELRLLYDECANKENLGMPMVKIEQQQKVVERNEPLIEFDVEEFLMTQANRGELQQQKFYFIWVNCFATSVKVGVYVPAEIAIAEYTLQGGVHCAFHRYVNPGNYLSGYQYNSSRPTHRLPPPPYAKGERDMDELLCAILNVICIPKTGQYAPLYTRNDSIDSVKLALDFMQKRTNRNKDYIKKLKVLSIQDLFYAMKRTTCEMGELEKPMWRHQTDIIFNNDCFEHESEIACSFHRNWYCPQFCAQSYVTRWGFMLSVNMCPDIAIELKPGRHMPSKARPEDFATAKSTVDDTTPIATCSTNASNTLTRQTDDNHAIALVGYSITTAEFENGIVTTEPLIPYASIATCSTNASSTLTSQTDDGNANAIDECVAGPSGSNQSENPRTTFAFEEITTEEIHNTSFGCVFVVRYDAPTSTLGIQGRGYIFNP